MYLMITVIAFDIDSLDSLILFRAIKLGKLMKCPTSNSSDLEACLQRVDASVLVTAQFGVMTGIGLGYPFLPVVDGVFLPDKIEVCFLHNCDMSPS